MTSPLPLQSIDSASRTQVGEKAWNLGRLARAEYPVPPTLVLPVGVYRAFLQATRLGERIGMELGRKDFAEMRWEEIWDAALRIRNLFLTTPLPEKLTAEILSAVRTNFGAAPLVIRSSAPGEDAPGSSFAGLHDSFVNVRGEQSILEAVAKVWGSLWSDRALLYRQELGLDARRSAMAVLVQPMVAGDCSGVVFSRSPVDPGRIALESVWGLNQGLVDGSIEPDRWELVREPLRIVAFHPTERSQALRADDAGVRTAPLAPAQRQTPPLTEVQVLRLARTALQLEELFGTAQDIEWTMQGDAFVLLQSRPITARRKDDLDDPRDWFRSLRRSFANLRILRREVEDNLMPAMEAEAEVMARIDTASLSLTELTDEIARRRRSVQAWENAYREKCIPLAHGVRLFGEFYNDLVKPQDPFAFVDLLQGEGLRAIRRNHRLEEWATRLRSGAVAESPAERVEGNAAELSSLAAEIGLGTNELAHLLREMARRPARTPEPGRSERLRSDFLGRFSEEEREQAEAMLELALASYRLRDDDNISIGKIRRQLAAAETEGRRRGILKEGPTTADAQGESERPESSDRWRVRQIQGQPAGAGIVTARVRVVRGREDLPLFRAGEILVCDAIDPSMTFVVPLAAAVVERRGGMLIHGAIIAREYGLPCVTGVPDATQILHTGQQATVDGYLGLVTIEAESANNT